MHINIGSFLCYTFQNVKRNGIIAVFLAVIGNTAFAQSACQVRNFSPDEENAIAAIVRDINGISSINHEIASRSRATLVRLVLTRWELLGAATPDISDGTLVANLLDLAASTSGETASALERSCSQVSELIAAETIPVPAVSMVSHEVGSAGTIAGLNGAKHSKRYFKVNVPNGVTDLVIQTNGADGDVDLYVSQGTRPIKNAAQCNSMGSNSDEQCRFDAPDGGAYYILLNGYADYSNLTLKVSWRGRGAPLAEILTGHLYDSAVQGVQYRSCNSLNAVDCIEGITGLRGEFNYTAGQQIEFKLGGLRIGVVQGQELVTPDKLANGDAGVALQIAQLLQSLDEDRDPSNGIVIPESVRSLAVGAYPNGQDVRFVNNSQVLSNLAPGRALVSMTQVGAHATGAALLDVMLANNSTVISKAILGTQNYLTTGKINYESLNTNVHARLRLALFNKKMTEEKGLLAILQRRGASITELEDDVKAWMRDIEVVKSYGDSAMAVLAILDSRDPAVIVEGLGTFAAFGNKVLLGEGNSLTDAKIESIKAATLHGAGMLDANPKKLLMSYLEALKATSSAGDLPVFKKSIESVQFGVECLNAFLDKTDKDFERFDNVYQCVAGGTELIAKGIIESAATGQLIITDQVAQVHGAAYDFLQAYYQSAGNPSYMREKYGMDFHKPSYDAQKMLNLDPTILTHAPIAGEVESAINFVKLVAYQYIISITMAEIDRETELYAQAFNLKYAGLLDLKAAGIANGSVVPVGTAVDFEATFKNMSAGSYTVRSINWLATGGGAPTVVATGTRANVRFNSAGTYSVAAHAEVLLPDGKTYFMVDSFTVAVQDAIPVPTLTLTATPGDGYVDLSWNAIAGATSYMVHMTASVVGPEGPPSIGTTSATSYRVNGLQNGALHRFTVRAFRGAEVMVGSGLASATPQGPAVPPVGELIAGRYLPIEGGAVIRDTVNGLEWLRCSVGQTWNGTTQRCDGTAATYNWDQATQLTAVGGFRIPTIAELKTLVYCSSGQPKLFGPLEQLDDFVKCSGIHSRPTVVQAAFPDAPASNVWSGSPNAYDSSLAWFVNFYSGGARDYNYRSLGNHVRLVRGAPSSPDLIAGRYLPIEGGAVIRDTVNGLEWQRCSVGQTWNGATQRCDGLARSFDLWIARQNYLSGEWVLPTENELATTIYCSDGAPSYFGQTCTGSSENPSIHGQAFPSTYEGSYWSNFYKEVDIKTCGSGGCYVTGSEWRGKVLNFNFYGVFSLERPEWSFGRIRLVRSGASPSASSVRKVNASALPPSTGVPPLLANLTGYDVTSPNAAMHGVRPDTTGRGAYFLSRATNLVPGINNGAHHLFHFDASTGQIKNLGASTSGAPGDGDITAFDVALQAGKLVFRTKATNLESGPGLYLVDLHTGQREPLVTSGRGEKHDPEAERPAINAQGTWVAWDQPGVEGAWRVLGLDLADRSGQPPTLLNETAQVACCVRFDAEGRYLAWREAATDGRVVVSVLDYATGRHATVEWPAGVVLAPDTLRVEFAQGGRTLQWVRIGDVLQGEGVEAGSLLHQVNNPLFTPPERLQ
ncbi:MAG: DUF1566 domain-containing protein [Burkholderiaceae bacterium]|nr:DUF1566 domain-containing protein [Burkholderiaceae bacterium]